MPAPTWRSTSCRVRWAIDHGAALYFHHAWTSPELFAAQPYDAGDHVLRGIDRDVARADAELAPRVTADLLTEVLALVPDVWLASDTAYPSVDKARAAYLEFLLARVEQRGAWLPGGAA